MKPDFSWFVGRQIKEIGKQDYTWFFLLDDGSNICTETFWRLVTSDGVAVTSEDHEQKFGLPAPVDAGKSAMEKIGDHSVERFELDERTGDLSLSFGANTLQFLTTSSGYENWRAYHGNQEIICMGGGRLLPIETR
jgi:hypothetical protein